MMRLSMLGLALLPALVHGLASTDSIQDVDPAQSGYLPNHNMDPKVITGGTFAQRWKNTYNSKEVFYAKPLTYTPNGAANELVITASNQNILRIVDGLTGALVNSRSLDPPFQSSDIGCTDIPNTVGITGTPIIDPSTDTMYFFSKGYKGGAVGPAGVLNGQYKFYAVHIPTLADVAGFPVIIDGHNANNDPTRYFLGGTVLQRPALASVGNVVIGGFGGHCDLFNYTGMLVSVSKTAGVGVTNVIAMEANPGAPQPQTLDYTQEGGGKAGIWQGGMGIAVDGDRIFFATGNGRGGGDNKSGMPANGKVPISTLDQCVANFAVDPSTGALTQSDYFEPFEYQNLDGADKDFGSAGVCLLDPTTFSGTGVSRMIVAGGKSGKVYVMNADDLGGFAQGPSGSDNVIQTITKTKAFFSGVGSYPGEGGYIYFNPTGDVLYAYQMGVDGTGKPTFTLAGTGKAANTFAGKGTPTVTSLNGQAGTGIVWLADVNNGLVAFNAIPVNGVLQQIPLPLTGRLTKFQRPAFGNGCVYVTSGSSVIALGPPKALPSTTSSPPPPVTTTTIPPPVTTTTVPPTIPATTTTVAVSTTLVTSTVPATTTAGVSAYQYMGCYRDISTGHALPLLFANNSVTPELCAAYVQSLAKQPTPTVLPYFYVEYHRECYGGSSFNFGTSTVTSLTGVHACTDVCSGSIGAAVTGTAFCGGSKQFNLYATGGVVSWPSQPTTASV